MPTERFDVSLTLKAQQEGKAAFSETEAGLKVVREAVKNFSEAEANGLGISAAYREAIAAFKSKALEAGLAFEGEAQAVRDATRAIDAFRAAEAAGLPIDEAVDAAMVEQTATAEANTAANEEQAGAMDAVMGANWGAVLAITAVVLAIGAAVAAIAPFVVIAYAGVVVIGAMVVVATALAAIFAALAVGVGGLGALVLMLANNIGGVSDPIYKLTRDFKVLFFHLGEAAVPIAREIVGWFHTMMPAITSVGLTIERWFGGAVPGILKAVSRIIKDLAPDFAAFGKFLAGAFGATGKVGLGGLFEDSVRAAIRFAEGLITNLLRIADWFHKEMPTFGPIASSVFGWLGDVIQSVAGIWSGMVDWVKKNWPWIMGIAKDAIKKFGDEWKTSIGPALDAFGKTVGPAMVIILKFIADHFDSIAAAVGLVIAAVLAVGVVLLALGAIFIASVMFGRWMALEISNAFDWVVQHATDMINFLIAAYDKIPGVSHVDLIRLPGSAGPPIPTVGATPRALAGGGDVADGEVFWAGEHGPELYVSHGGGHVFTSEQSASMGTDMSTVERYLKMIEAHLAFMKSEAPSITATAMVRRGA